MASIGSVSGLASGIQWRDMVEQLVALERSRKLAPVTNQASTQQLRSAAWTSFNGALARLSAASTGLIDGNALSAVSASVPKTAAGKETFAVLASTIAVPGTYGVEVTALAKSDKISGAAVSDATATLGYAGVFHINGAAVSVSASDSLNSLRDKLNAANTGANPSGVTASILRVSATEHYLTLSADQTGTRGIELVDSGNGTSASGVLVQLGVLDGTQGTNQSASDATKHQTQRFESKTTTVAAMLGLTAPPAAANIVVDGERVHIDLQNDSLQDVLDKIDTAAAAAAKTIETSWVEEQVAGTTKYRLQTGTVTVDTDGFGAAVPESQRIVELLGLVQGSRANSLQTGADSKVVIDGLAMERRSNIVSDALPGVTLTLKAEEIGTTVDFVVSRNLDAGVKSVEGFVAAYNAVLEFVDKQRVPGSPLYANGSLRSMVVSLKNSLLSNVPGIDTASTAFTRPTIAGVSFTRDGKLELDAELLRSSLETNFSEVKSLFGTNGSSSFGNVTYVSASRETNPGSYAVQITQLATVAVGNGAAWTTSYDGSGPDQMTVSDAYSGRSAVIALENGDTIDTVVEKLNNAYGSMGSTLTASRSAGDELVISGSRYGSAASFTVSYQQGGADWAGAAPTGLAAATYAGLDVAGTVGGAAATGLGQILTADPGTEADGLSLQYTGSATGAAGDITYVRGVTGELERLVQSYTRGGDGTIALHIATLEASVSRLEMRELDVEGRLERYEEQLLRQFIAMETALSSIQAKGNWLAGQINGLLSSSD